jgi:hypothetical protein
MKTFGPVAATATGNIRRGGKAMITRREFSKLGLGFAAVSTGAHTILGARGGRDGDAPSQAIPPKEWTGGRRTGIRPNGTYWGGGPEQIDVLSGNLSYSLPVVLAGGRGVNVRIPCSYNSQMWERDNPKVLSYGADTGVGYGWRVQMGSVVPQLSGRSVTGYSFISDTGAEFPLSPSQGVWVSLQGLFVSYDPSWRRLQFPDGTFWIMGCESASGEADAGGAAPDAGAGQERQPDHRPLYERNRRAAGKHELPHTGDTGFSRRRRGFRTKDVHLRLRRRRGSSSAFHYQSYR